MSSNGSRRKKNSKDAKAERILRSLFLKNKSSLAPSSKKIRKKRRQTQEQSWQLHFRTTLNQRKTLQWVLPQPPSSRKKGSFGNASSKRRRAVPRQEDVREKPNPFSEEVNYADLFESAYQVFKSESSASRSGKQVVASSEVKTENASQNRSTDSYSGIEYDPADNYFYLVSHQTPDKRPLFENKGILRPVQKPCLVINPRIVESLKKDYALESFLC